MAGRPPQESPQALASEEARSEVESRCLSAGAADIASVEAAKEQSSRGIQKPPQWVGQKRFPGACWTAPEVAEKEEIPAVYIHRVY
jgi:hypothetical protein